MYKTGIEATDSLAAPDRTKDGSRAPTLDFFVSLLLIFFIVYKISFVPETAMQALKCLSIALLILMHRRAMRHVDHFWAVVLLALVQPVCTLLAGETLMNGAYALVNGLCLISLLLTFKSLSMSFGSFRVADSFFWLLLAVSMANDISVFLSPFHRAETEYLLGNKFITGYTHMLLVGLYAVLLSRKSGYVCYNWGAVLDTVFRICDCGDCCRHDDRHDWLGDRRRDGVAAAENRCQGAVNRYCRRCRLGRD